MFHSYTVEILKKAFVISDEIKYTQTVRLHMLDSHGNIIDIKDYAYVEAAEIYNDIAAGKEIDLNNCYVKNFSLSEYRSENGLATDAHVEINGITAISSFPRR